MTTFRCLFIKSKPKVITCFKRTMRLDDQDANLAEATATVKDRYPDLEALYQEVEWVADPLV